MAAYLVLLFAVLSRILPHTFGTTSVGFTAVGGGLLYFGARRGRWHTIAAVAALMATDYYLTTYVYHFAFHASEYVVTWIWYAAICLLGHQMLQGKPSMARVGVAVLASSTSFFILSNFMVWLSSGMYPHTASGLVACYVAAIPFYANDAMSTAVTAGALFGLPALASSISESLHEAHSRRAA
jgi:predicted cupin superfamily sugar epimerase